MPALYLQLLEQFRQWIVPDDKRHLTVFAEIIALMLLSSSASLHHWLLGLYIESAVPAATWRLSYFVNTPQITAVSFYEPLLKTCTNQSFCQSS
jgi:hypothetical protein